VLAVPVILNITISISDNINFSGYKLAKPATFIHFLAKRKISIYSFIATLVAVVTTDLLKGVLLGIVISIIFILKGI
jgi:MFS superfamily sulfate permease-like transporter